MTVENTRFYMIHNFHKLTKLPVIMNHVFRMEQITTNSHISYGLPEINFRKKAYYKFVPDLLSSKLIKEIQPLYTWK